MPVLRGGGSMIEATAILFCSCWIFFIGFWFGMDYGYFKRNWELRK